MDSILEKIEQAIKDLLIGWIESNLTNMFTDVNDKVGTIASEVGRTPSAWNSGIYSMIRGLSENVIVPIAGIIITFVLCYELISMITEKNNMHEMDTWMFFKWFFKAAVAIYLVTNTFDIVMAVFDIGQNVVAGAAGVIHAVDSATTDCQPNDNVEALRVFMLAKKVECRPVWKPMHKQPVYKNAPAYVNGVSEAIFKVGMCLPAGPYVTDEDVKYIVECIKEAIIK